jgi:hypothetical protein
MNLSRATRGAARGGYGIAAAVRRHAPSVARHVSSVRERRARREKHTSEKWPEATRSQWLADATRRSRDAAGGSHDATRCSHRAAPGSAHATRCSDDTTRSSMSVDRWLDVSAECSTSAGDDVTEVGRRSRRARVCSRDARDSRGHLTRTLASRGWTLALIARTGKVSHCPARGWFFAC